MKKIILAILIPFFGSSQNNKLDEKNGFEWYVFGSSPRDYNNLNLEIDDGEVKLYTCSQNFSKFEGVKFDDINISFSKDKLSTISFKTKSSTGLKFLQKLKEMYGEPKASTIKKGDYEWLSNKVKLLYEHTSPTDAQITFYCRNLKQ
jgi:hypothetical protein